MIDSIREILADVVDAAVLEDLHSKWDEMLDRPLSQLGVDSLASVVILDRLEDDFDVAIDYDTFALRDISTIRKLTQALERRHV